MTQIGFIGTGVMGAAIVKNLLANHYQVNVFNRTKSKTDSLVALGAVWQDNPKQIAEASDVIFTMVGFPADVEKIYFGEEGIFQAAQLQDKILIDLTTSTPRLAEKIFEKAKAVGAKALDAPVSGGDLGAKNATMTIMVGGEEETFQQVLPILKAIGRSIAWHGEAGKGQHTKMANQIMIAGTMTGMTEMLVYAEKVGLDLPLVIQTLEGGSAANWSLSNYAPRILKEDYSPGFFVKHFVKDLKIALSEAKAMNLDLPATELAEKLYERLIDQGFEDEGTQALVLLWWQE